MTVESAMEVEQEQQQRQFTAREKGKQPAANSPPSSDSLPWIEKYRPQQLKDLVSHQDIISTINKFIDAGQLPHLLLYGPPGTGKTSTVLACARKMYGEDYRKMILELNASDDRGIDVVREQIITFASTKQIFNQGVKLIILDEADSMTQPAQAALRRVMEKYTRNVRFCIICNYVSKIIPAIQSRCTRFRFAPLKREQIQDRLNFIVQQEGIVMKDDGMTALMRLAKGDMRRALNIMQSVHAAYNLVNEENVYSCVGAPLPKDIESIVHALLEKDFAGAYDFISTLKVERGLALADLVTEVFQFALNIDFPAKMKTYLIKELADIEFRSSSGCSEKLQLSSLIATFQIGRDIAAGIQSSLS
ncbi:hypothetical protein MP228_000160 [Amoeboaphelidium protococcarum]|nr:hypothetical protein MP228_000160 [Amoeboaphelidium protococcarum]